MHEPTGQQRSSPGKHEWFNRGIVREGSAERSTV